MKRKTKYLLLVVDLLLILALVGGIFLFQKKAGEKEAMAISQEDLAKRYVKTIAYQGQEYPLKRNITSVLLIGTDNYIDDSKQNKIEAHYNRNHADFLVILVFDHSKKTITPFQICRDTMCDVPWLSVNGKIAGTEVLQISYAHTFGTGKEDSCINTRNAVERLIYGVPINNFLAFTMETVPLVNDLVGGVTVTLENDYPGLGEEYVKGATVTLKGNAALRFVRYRDTSLVGDNYRRMANHRLYLEAFTDAARAAAAKNQDLFTEAFKKVEKYLCTDLSLEQFSDMVDNLNHYTLLPTVCPTGEYKMGEQYAEFYMDDTSLWSGVKATFCS